MTKRISDFNGLHSGEHNAEVQLYAFDMLAGDGDDMRKLPLSMRKTNLARLLRGRAEGIFVAGPKRCRSKAVAALVSERRTKRRGERAGTCWPPVLPKKCFAISVGRPTLNFGVARGECSVFSSPQGHGSGSPIGPSSFGAAQMPQRHDGRPGRGGARSRGKHRTRWRIVRRMQPRQGVWTSWNSAR
jgi:hypothetical protein